MSRIEISKKLVLVNSASSAVMVALNLSVLVWLQQYLIKRISPEEYSLMPIVTSIMAFTPLLSTVLTGGLGRYVTVAYAKGDDEEVTRICSTMFPILVAVAAVVLLIGWTCAWNVDRLLKIAPERVPEARAMLAILVFTAAVQLPFATFRTGFMVRQKLVLQDVISMGCQLLRMAILFALLFGVSTRVLWAIVASAISDLVNIVISVPISLRLVPAQRVRRDATRWSLARELTSYGGWSLIDQLAQTVKVTMDPLLLNRFASALDVATLYVAGMVPRQLGFITLPISRPFIPVLAAMHAVGDFTRLRNTYLRTARYNSWILMALSVPAIIFGKELMTLYLGAKYHGAGTIMTILLVASLLSTLNVMGPAAAAAAGEMKKLAIRQILVQVVNLALTVLFVVYMRRGAYGSAAATLLATLGLEPVLTWRLCWQITHTQRIHWLREVLAPVVVPALPPIVLCLSVKWTLGVGTWVKLLSASALSGILYVSLVVWFGLRQQDKIDLARLAERLPGRAKALVRRLGNA